MWRTNPRTLTSIVFRFQIYDLLATPLSFDIISNSGFFAIFSLILNNVLVSRMDKLISFIVTYNAVYWCHVSNMLTWLMMNKTCLYYRNWDFETDHKHINQSVGFSCDLVYFSVFTVGSSINQGPLVKTVKNKPTCKMFLSFFYFYY